VQDRMEVFQLGVICMSKAKGYLEIMMMLRRLVFLEKRMNGHVRYIKVPLRGCTWT